MPERTRLPYAGGGDHLGPHRMTDSEQSDDWYDPWREFYEEGTAEDWRFLLEEGTSYNGVSTELVVRALRPGDMVRVRLMRKDEPTITLIVEEKKSEFAEVVDEDENEYLLWANTSSRSNRRVFNETWLRKPGGDSVGIVDQVTVRQLADV